MATGNVPISWRLCRDHSDIDSGVKTNPMECPACIARNNELGPVEKVGLFRCECGAAVKAVYAESALNYDVIRTKNHTFRLVR